MQFELDSFEIKKLIEAVDCLKTKIAFTKGLSAAEKTQKLLEAEALEKKLLNGASSKT